MKPITKTIKPGNHLFHENDRSRELYIIQSGSIKVYRKTGNGEIELANLGKGAVVGEMALIDGKPRSASAKAIDNCTVIMVDSETFFKQIAGVPDWFITIIRMASHKIRQANLKLKSGPREHQNISIIIALFYLVNKFNKANCIEFQMLNSHLNQLLCLSQHQISSVLEYLKENKFIQIDSNILTIPDIVRYREYCDFLRIYLRTRLTNIIPFSAKMNTLLVNTADDCPEIMTSSEPATTISGTTFWSFILKAGLGETYNEVLTLFRECNLLTSIRVDFKGEKNINPLNSINFKINNTNWKKICLYVKFNNYIPLVAR